VAKFENPPQVIKSLLFSELAMVRTPRRVSELTVTFGEETATSVYSEKFHPEVPPVRKSFVPSKRTTFCPFWIPVLRTGREVEVPERMVVPVKEFEPPRTRVPEPDFSRPAEFEESIAPAKETDSTPPRGRDV